MSPPFRTALQHFLPQMFIVAAFFDGAPGASVGFGSSISGLSVLRRGCRRSSLSPPVGLTSGVVDLHGYTDFGMRMPIFA